MRLWGEGPVKESLLMLAYRAVLLRRVTTVSTAASICYETNLAGEQVALLTVRYSGIEWL